MPTGIFFDNFAYKYLVENNHLVQNCFYHINDPATPLTSGADIIDQGTFTSTPATINTANNYSYDEIGNLKRDSSEQIHNIEWTVYGKVKKIERCSASVKPDLEFLYDPSGNRIAKIVKPYNHKNEPAYWTYNYYTRDAQGNTMATYEYTNNGTSTFKLMEHDLYGSSRLGTDNSDIDLLAAQVNETSFTHTLGNKQYELTNHLGNVLATVTDKKIAVDANSDGTVDYYLADIGSSQDYYPFGMLMPGRNFNTNKYKFGFNGKEKDNEIFGTEGSEYAYKFRLEDSRIGRFLSVDPLASKFPWNSNYAFSENRVIDGVELEGLEVYLLNDKAPMDKAIIEGFKNSENNSEFDKSAIHVYCHSFPTKILGPTGFVYPEDFGKLLSQYDDRFKNRKNGEEIVIVIHGCRSGRLTKNSKGEFAPSFAQQVSILEHCVVIAPDERNYVGSKEFGPFVTKGEDANGDMSKEALKSNPEKLATGQRGHWNVYKNGKLISQYDGSWIPKSKPSFWDIKTKKKE